MSLRDWNDTRHKQGYTTHLHYTHQYEDMQKSLNQTMHNVNQHIFFLNNTNNVDTPILAGVI